MTDELDPLDELLDLISPRFRVAHVGYEWHVVLHTPASHIPPTRPEFDTVVQSFPHPDGKPEGEAKSKAIRLARALNAVLRM